MGVQVFLDADNPESGTIYYTYEDSGDLLTRTDARNITTTMDYDPLHRISSKTYTGETPETPDVYYYYYEQGDTAPNIGRLKSVSTDGIALTVYGYDVLGRVTDSAHTVTGYSEAQVFQYDWHVNDSLKSILYPSGRLVHYDVDDAGRTEKVYTSNITSSNII